MAGIDETNRRRVASVLLSAGILLILVGIIIIAFQRSTPMPPVGPQKGGPTPLFLRRFLYVLILLVLLFCVSVVAFLRWSRHFRKLILHKPAPPTPAEDVWQMHRLPPEADVEDGDDLPQGGLEPPAPE